MLYVYECAIYAMKIRNAILLDTLRIAIRWKKIRGTPRFHFYFLSDRIPTSDIFHCIFREREKCFSTPSVRRWNTRPTFYRLYTRLNRCQSFDGSDATFFSRVSQWAAHARTPRLLISRLTETFQKQFRTIAYANIQARGEDLGNRSGSEEVGIFFRNEYYHVKWKWSRGILVVL